MKTRYFSADIGTWEKGTVYRFTARNESHAIKVAFKHSNNVVQIRELEKEGDFAGRIFFDYINGHMTYTG